MVNRDHPCPPKETLINMGNLIKDCTPHEVNMSLYLHNEMPTSVFAMG